MQETLAVKKLRQISLPGNSAEKLWQIKVHQNSI